MARKPKPPPLTAFGVIVSVMLYMVAFPYTVQVAVFSARQGDNFFAVFFAFLSLVIVSFEYHHIDMYSSQRGEQFNLAAILVFFAVSMFLINGAVEG